MHGVTATTIRLPPIEEVVPHSGPMILLDRLIEYEAPSPDQPGTGRILADLRLRPDSKFVRDGKARAIVMVEYMAQAVAAYAGMLDRDKGDPIQIGYLIGIRELLLDVDTIGAGDHLEVSAVHVFGSRELGSFETRVTRDDRTIASATLTVYRGKLPEDGE
jgi:predicted hotdog family 3-hydroxylacyl-ACP dehydratase